MASEKPLLYKPCPIPDFNSLPHKFHIFPGTSIKPRPMYESFANKPHSQHNVLSRLPKIVARFLRRFIDK
jgi:hypothetical protein